jgi:hypothetical protein
VKRDAKRKKSLVLPAASKTFNEAAAGLTAEADLCETFLPQFSADRAAAMRPT